MRARLLKPEFFRDRKVGALGPVTAIVFQALWCVADDVGTAPCDVEQLKGDMFLFWPSIGVGEIDAALRALEESGRISARYRVGDDTFTRITRFTKHQKVHKPSQFRHPQVGAAVTPGSAAPVTEECRTTPALPASCIPYPNSYQLDGSGSGEALVPEHYLTRCVVALNEGMQQNAHVINPREISTSSQLGKVTWETDGIPIDLALSVIGRVAAAFRPTGQNRQISSLKYCDAAVREAWQDAGMRPGPGPESSEPLLPGARSLADHRLLKAQGY